MSEQSTNLQNKPATFDRSKTLRLKIVSGGIAYADLKFPTDAQWFKRASQQKTVRSQIGRDKSTVSAAVVQEHDLELFRALAVNEEERQKYGAADAAAFIDRLDRATVEESKWISQKIRRIVLMVPGGVEVTHFLRVPTQEQMQAHDDAAPKPIFSKRTTEIRYRMEPDAELWDKVVDSVEGYEGGIAGVPANHKAAAVISLLESLSSLLEGDDIPEASGLDAGQSAQASGS